MEKRSRIIEALLQMHIKTLAIITGLAITVTPIIGQMTTTFASELNDNSVSVNTIETSENEIDNVDDIDEIKDIENGIAKSFSDLDFDVLLQQAESISKDNVDLEIKTDEYIPMQGQEEMYSDVELEEALENIETEENLLEIEEASKQDVENFVERAYTEILNRGSDAGGKEYWVSGITTGKDCGASIISKFINSDEYIKQNKSNEEFVEDLYKSCLGRESDAGGKEYWLNQIASGKTRNEVMAGFVNSVEYTGICERYGISRGTMELDGSVVYNPGARSFVERNYQEILGRQHETAGAEYWTKKVCDGNLDLNTFVDCAKGFFYSDEYINKNKTNAQFIEDCYHTFLGRESDADGKQYWIAKMELGMSKEEIMNGFAYSDEFRGMVEEYKKGNSPVTQLDKQREWRKAEAQRVLGLKDQTPSDSTTTIVGGWNGFHFTNGNPFLNSEEER